MQPMKVTLGGGYRGNHQVVRELTPFPPLSFPPGTFVALITVCRKQRQGERGLIVYQVTRGLLGGYWGAYWGFTELELRESVR